MSRPAPDTSAFYERWAALPFAQAPAGLSSYTLGQWFAGAKLRVDALIWSFADEVAKDPGVPGGDVRLRSVAINATEGMLVPRDIPARAHAGASTDGVALDAIPLADWKRLWSDVAYERLSMKKGESEADFAARTAGLLLWDDAASKASPLSIPFHSDESLVAAWGSPPTATDLPPLTADLPGALAAAPPAVPHLLATPKQGGAGELDARLLRAPATGIFRFERYQHVVRKSTGELTLRRPSHDGRIVVLTTAVTMLADASADDFDDVADLDKPLRFAFENVAANSLPEVLPSLFVDQVRRFGTLLDSNAFTHDKAGLRKYLVDVVGWLLRTWQAVAALTPARASVPSSIAARLATLVPAGASKAPDEGPLREAAALAIGDAQAHAALIAYVQTIFVPLMLGARWSEVGVPVDPAGPLGGTPAQKDAIEFSRLCERWIPCFAGCPLGKAGIAWILDDGSLPAFDAAAGTFPDAARAHRKAFSTFEVEALYQARVGASGETIADHTAARAGGLIGELDLIHYGDDVLHGRRSGWIAVLRLVESDAPGRSFTTLDWIREIALGTVRRRYQEALLDYSGYGGAFRTPHPLAALVEWDRYAKARVLRDRMDRLLGTRFGADSLHASTLTWWRDNTKLADTAGKWPASFVTTVGAVRAFHRIAPAPRTCYMAAGTATSSRDRAVTKGRQILRQSDDSTVAIPWNIEGGWDDFDLVAVQKAASVVRDGRTLAGPIHPALVLAVADIEGYRVFMGQNRIRTAFFDQMWGSGTSFLASSSRPGGSRRDAFTEALARALWQVWTFGLDLWNHPRAGPAPDLFAFDFPETSAAHMRWVLNRLTRVDWEGEPGVIILGAPDPDRSLIDLSAFPPAGDLPRFIATRLQATWTTAGGANAARFSRLSRQLEWIGLTMQAATFQWVHRQLSKERGFLTGEVYQRVDELVNAALPPPLPGPNAASIERRNYISYWSTVYLAFNASVSFWNHWIARAGREKALADRLTNHLLFKLDNHTADPVAMDDTLAKRLGTLGAMTRFAVALDAYTRLDFSVDLAAADPAAVGFDASDPRGRVGWSTVP